MKKIIYLLSFALLFTTVVFYGCQKEPIASFTVSKTTVNVGESVSFTNTSADADSYQWDFGDGSTSTSVSQTHTYNTAGTYTVTLTVFSKNGKKSDIATEEITVSEITGQAPVANFKTNTTNITVGSTVNFTDLSTNTPTSWAWHFGDGGISNTQNSSHTYSSADTFTVSLTAINAFGYNTETKYDYITVSCSSPAAEFTANLTSITKNRTVYFTDLSTNSPDSWVWAFPSGPSGIPNSSTLQNPAVKYDTVGTYDVTLIAINACDSDTITKYDYITVEELVMNIPCPGTPTVTDADGNVYNTVQIGTQCWIAENLNVSHYRNGDAIPNVTDNTQWDNLTTSAWCYYNNNSGYENPYGKLYNWYTVVDSRGLCPTGWHIPTHYELTTLERAICTSGTCNTDFPYDFTTTGWRGTDEGGKLKETGTIHWNSPNTGATNESGFSALPGGYRYSNGEFDYMGYYAYFCSSSEYYSYNAWFRKLHYYFGDVSRDYYDKNCGFSVRCVKD